MEYIERTLIVFKPDAVQRGVVGEILTRFERVGLKIIGTKMMAPNREHYHKHYEDIGKMISRHGEDKFELALALMSKGPVIAMVLEGVEAIEIVRKLIGATEPKKALPGTIRGDYSHMSYGYGEVAQKGFANLLHASGDAEEAKQEIAHWFREDELYDYSVLHEKFTR